MLNVGEDVDATNRPASKYDETNVGQPDVIYLRLLRQGSQLIGAYSDDGIAYRELGSVTNELSIKLNVGVGAANGNSESCGPACEVLIPAHFDYFQISDLDGDPAVGPPMHGTITSLSIEGPEQFVSGGSGIFRAIARYSDGTSGDVSEAANWAVAPPVAGTIENGTFAAAPSNVEIMVTVVATYTEENSAGPITRTSASLVRIKPNAFGSRLCGTGIVALLPFLSFPFAWRGFRRHVKRSYF
jgi:hypothetical protein